MEGVCEECCHVKKDLYPRNPHNGRVEGEGGKRWCAECFERISARRAREQYAPDEKDQLYAG